MGLTVAESPHYDIALSFAGEDREYVHQVANSLDERGIKVFYDIFEEADLWGKDLYVHLTEVYQKQARFTVMFISEHYAAKLWTNHERRAAQARAFQEAQEYILPARFDDTEIPGVLPTVGYIGLKGRTPDDLASVIAKKLVSSGGSIPTELVRRDYSVLARKQPGSGSEFLVTVRDNEGLAVQGCTVSLQAENNTLISSKSDVNGRALFSLKVRRPSVLLISNPKFPAAVYHQIDPVGEMEVVLTRLENIGSVTFNSTGYIPGLKGRLNPILDTSNRTYLYADNVAIEGGAAQPVAFKIGVPFELEDVDGSIVYATVRHIRGRVSLIQFTRKPEN